MKKHFQHKNQNINNKVSELSIFAHEYLTHLANTLLKVLTPNFRHVNKV